MGRMSRFPLLLDSCFQLTTGALRRFGLIVEGEAKHTEVLFIRRYGFGPERKLTIWIFSDFTDEDDSFVELIFLLNNKKIYQKIFFSWHPSNLGKGRVWYFHCPDTGRRCRKLYLVYSSFVSRYAVPEAMYDSQTASKKYRFIDKHYGDYFKADKAYQAINKKYFKRYYKSKPTKKYQAMMDIIERSKSFTDDEIQRLYIM